MFIYKNIPLPTGCENLHTLRNARQEGRHEATKTLHMENAFRKNS